MATAAPRFPCFPFCVAWEWAVLPTDLAFAFELTGAGAATLAAAVGSGGGVEADTSWILFVTACEGVAVAPAKYF